jgi:hypothetical protein
MKHTHLAAAFISVLAASAPARADWEYTRWGMTPEQVAAASGGAVKVIPKAERRKVEAMGMENGAEGQFTDGPLRLRVAFGFDIAKDSLRMVTYGVLDPAQNEMFKDWVIRRHGPPQQQSAIPVIGLESFSWTAKDELNLMITKGDQAFVMQSPQVKR